MPWTERECSLVSEQLFWEMQSAYGFGNIKFLEVRICKLCRSDCIKMTEYFKRSSYKVKETGFGISILLILWKKLAETQNDHVLNKPTFFLLNTSRTMGIYYVN